MHPSGRLRQLLSQNKLLVAPGAFDCLSARSVELAGFSAIYMTGMGTAASRLGLPDYGLATMTEMVENASAMAAVVDIPIIADADTGYGNELNMTRTVREHERHGIAGIHIEDQVFPKKCGHLDQKQVVPRSAFISKLRAAVNARSNPDFVIIGRTDCNSVLGFEEAIIRANAALDVGVDLALVEAPESVEQMRAVPERVHGPCALNVLLGGKSPLLPLSEIEAMGYRCVLLSDVLLGTAISAYETALRTVRHSRQALDLGWSLRPGEIFQRLRAEEWDKLRPVQEEALTDVR